MERYFRMEDKSLCNVIDHCLEQVSTRDNLKIYIATDSQVKKKETFFATVIVFRYGTNGAHYIYSLERLPKKNFSHFERLMDEARRTIETAQMITEGAPIKIEALEFDYNGIKKTMSSSLISVARGWAMGLGFNPIFKGGQMIAAKAGDHVCRKKDV